MKEANREVVDRGSLAELLVQRARQASDLRLAVDAAVGLILSAAVIFFRPPLWLPLAALAFSFGAFGLWGILDREVTDAPVPRRRTLVLTRGVVAVLGAVAAAFGSVILFFGLLGTWIS